MIAVVSLLVFSASFCQEETGSVPTNLEQIRTVAEQIALQAAVTDAGVQDSVHACVTVLPRETSWYIERALWEGLKKGKIIPVAGDSGCALQFAFGLSDVSVTYLNVHRESILGAKVVDRKVSLSLESKVIRQLAGRDTRVSSRLISDSISDVIDLSDVSRVENPALVVTKGRLPQEGFFANLAEPLVLIGTIAIAVFLLFNVRS
jgi:hypothetical protein